MLTFSFLEGSTWPSEKRKKKRKNEQSPARKEIARITLHGVGRDKGRTNVTHPNG